MKLVGKRVIASVVAICIVVCYSFSMVAFASNEEFVTRKDVVEMLLIAADDYNPKVTIYQYSEVYNGVEKDALFSFNHIGFSYSSHTIMLQDSTTYSISESDWSSITDESTVALGVFYRVQECSEYAEEKFSQYNFGIHLF